MRRTLFNTYDEIKSVEPVRRMVGGRYGFAHHRFPIKGGITPSKALSIMMGEELSRAVNRKSYFSALLASGTLGESRGST